MLLDDLGLVLQAAGVGTLGTNLFKTGMPAAPDTAVAILESGGMPPVRGMTALPGHALLERPSLQVLVRSTDYPVARARAELAFKALDGYRGTSGGRRYWVAASQSPYLIQRDANDRVWLGFSALVTKTLD